MTIFPKESTLWERRLLAALLAASALTIGMYSVVSPLFEGPDELLHFRFVQHIAIGGGIPVVDPANLGPWRQEALQAPLYQLLAGASISWIAMPDPDQVLIYNPHGELRVLDGNLNSLIHDWQAEAFPWRGLALAGHVARLVALLMGVGAIYAAYRLGLELFPGQRWLALAGAAVMSFTPMFGYVSGAVNPDSTLILLCTLSLWQMARILRAAREGWYGWRMAFVLGVLLGLGALAKTPALPLFWLAGPLMAYVAYRRRDWRTFFRDGLLIVGLALAIAGWWYVRNYHLYGSPITTGLILQIVGSRQPTLDLLPSLWRERQYTDASYWGMFVSAGIPMADWTYNVLNAAALLGAVGLIVRLVRHQRRDGWQSRVLEPLILVAAWGLIIALLVVQYGLIHNTPEGRHTFAAIAVYSLAIAGGVGGSLPRRAGQIAAGVLVAFMLVLSWIAPFAWLLPQIAPPPLIDPAAVTSAHPAVDFYEPGAASPSIRLLDYAITPSALGPGQNLHVALTWQVEARMTRNWSLFVHVIDQDGIIVTQRDSYPGRGSLATSRLDPGTAWREEFLVPVPDVAYAPDSARVTLGWYDLADGQRMTRAGGSDGVAELGPVDVTPRGGASIPNALEYHFGDSIELVGYEVSPRSLRPGDTLRVTLYWRGQSQITRSYKIFVHVLGTEDHIWAGSDSRPASGQHPTQKWTPGEVVRDDHSLTLDPATPAGIYPLEIGVYWSAPGGDSDRLNVINSLGQDSGSSLELSSVAVTP